MKKLLFLIVCCLAINLTAKAQTKFSFDIGNGRTVEAVSPRVVTPAEEKAVIEKASYRGANAARVPVHVYYYNPRTGWYDYQYSFDLTSPPFNTLGEMIDFLLAIWDYL